MGITIHYAGQLRDPANLENLIAIVRDRSEKAGWGFALLPYAVGDLQGFVVHPHPDCEPLEFRFGKRNRFSSWVKTQFAGPEIHIQIVRLLQEIKPVIGRLGITDEGEFWQTGSEETLRWHMNHINELIASYIAENADIQTKVRTPDGRIIDLIE
jgi:hypothetical protein